MTLHLLTLVLHIGFGSAGLPSTSYYLILPKTSPAAPDLRRTVTNSSKKKGPYFFCCCFWGFFSNSEKNPQFIIWANQVTWPSTGPITEAKGLECPDWSGPSHMLLPLEPVDGASPTQVWWAQKERSSFPKKNRSIITRKWGSGVPASPKPQPLTEDLCAPGLALSLDLSELRFPHL